MDINSFERFGSWFTSYSFYIKQSKKILEEAEIIQGEIDRKIDEIEDEKLAKDPSYIEYIVHDEKGRLNALCISSQLFSCMAVEGFLNYYGVVRFGERFYKRNIERVPIRSKVEIIIAIGEQILLEEEEELTRIVQTMFDSRNALVHPKTKEAVKNGEFIIPVMRNNLEEARESIERMDKFFEIMRNIDSNISDFHVS